MEKEFFTSLCRLSPANGRATHLSDADGQLIPWIFAPLGPDSHTLILLRYPLSETELGLGS